MNLGIYRPKDPEHVKARILDACAELLSQGLPLSIGTVAEVAEVTKGAVQHHFGTRAQLLMAFHAQAVADIQASLQVAQPTQENAAQRYVRASLQMLPTPQENQRRRAWVAASVMEPDVAQAWCDWLEADRAAEPESAEQLVARLAADGLWLAETLGAYQLTAQDKQRVAQVLQRLAAGSQPAASSSGTASKAG